MMQPNRRLLLILFVVLATVSGDQLSKIVATEYLKGQVVVPVLGRFLVLRHAENPGAFMSMGAGWPQGVRFSVLIVLSAAILVGIAVYLWRSSNLNTVQVIGFALVLGGGMSNVVDRILHGGLVVDFMNLGIGRIRSGVFNLADVFILTGIVLAFLPRRKPSPQPSENDARQP